MRDNNTITIIVTLSAGREPQGRLLSRIILGVAAAEEPSVCVQCRIRAKTLRAVRDRNTLIDAILNALFDERHDESLVINYI